MKRTLLPAVLAATAVLAVAAHRLQRTPPFSPPPLRASILPYNFQVDSELVQLRPYQRATKSLFSDGRVWENTVKCDHSLYFRMLIGDPPNFEIRYYKLDRDENLTLAATFRNKFLPGSRVECKEGTAVVLMAELLVPNAPVPTTFREFFVDTGAFSGRTFTPPQRMTISEEQYGAIVLENTEWKWVSCLHIEPGGTTVDLKLTRRCTDMIKLRLNEEKDYITDNWRTYQVFDTEMSTQTWFVEPETHFVTRYRKYGAPDGFTFNDGTGIITAKYANIYIIDPGLADSRLRKNDNRVRPRFAEQPDGSMLFLHPQGVMRFDHLWNRLDSPAWTARVAKAARFASTFENLQILFALLAPLLIIGLHLWRRTTKYGPWIALAAQLYAAWTIWLWSYGI
jgi:hypothetical protein